MCELLCTSNSFACELEAVRFDASKAAVHSAANVLQPWDGFWLNLGLFKQDRCRRPTFVLSVMAASSYGSAGAFNLVFCVVLLS